MITVFRKSRVRLLASVLGLAVLFGCQSPSSPSGDSTGSTSAVQIVATWDSAADVDLHVVEPSGTEIYWGNMGPTATGGSLNVDANDECRQNLGVNKEIVSWAVGAPNGVYTVRIDLYENCNAAPTNYSVAITNGGRALPALTGILTGIGDVGATGAGQLVTTFTHTSSSLTARHDPPNALRFFAIFLTGGPRVRRGAPRLARAPDGHRT